MCPTSSQRFDGSYAELARCRADWHCAQVPVDFHDSEIAELASSLVLLCVHAGSHMQS